LNLVHLRPLFRRLHDNDIFRLASLLSAIAVRFRPTSLSGSAHVAVRELLALIGYHLGGRGILSPDKMTNERTPVVTVISLDLLANTTNFVNDRIFHIESLSR
jgi:hypothetical protein